MIAYYNSELYHFGIKGMKWGVRRYQNKDGSLTPAGEIRYHKESNKQIKTNPDGSQTIPKGFIFNRVGQSSLDINKSGALYVSHGKQDAARYIKALGPTKIGKLMGTAHDTVQHISVKKDIKKASNEEVAKGMAEILLSNDNILKEFNESIFVMAVTDDWDKSITKQDVEAALKNPSSKEAQKLAYGISNCLGDGEWASHSKIIYDHFRKKGYDAMPDLADVFSGTSETATIVFNPDKLEITSTTTITKDVYKEGKRYAKSLEKLKVSDLIS